MNECDSSLLFFIRHPLRRFVSAFNHAKSIIDFDIEGVALDLLTTENCPCPWRIKYKKENSGIAFDHEFDSLIKHFNSASELGEALSASDFRDLECALSL